MIGLPADLAALQETSLWVLNQFLAERRPWPSPARWRGSLDILASRVTGAGDLPSTYRGLSWPALADRIAAARRTLAHGLASLPHGTAESESFEVDLAQLDQSERHRRLHDGLVRLWTGGLHEGAVGLYLHGSLATRDDVNYSDCDTLVVLCNDAVTEPEALLRLRHALAPTMSILKAFDPYQHHSHFVVSEADLRAYPEPFLPVAALRVAAVVRGSGRLAVRTRKADDYARQQCRSLAGSVVAERHQHPARWTGHALKSFLSRLMLLPALVLGARGSFVYKRDSFALARPLFTEEEWSGVEWASRLRSVWPRTTTFMTLARAGARARYAHAFTDYVLRRLPVDPASRLGLPDLTPDHLERAVVFARRCLAFTARGGDATEASR